MSIYPGSGHVLLNPATSPGLREHRTIQMLHTRTTKSMYVRTRCLARLEHKLAPCLSSSRSTFRSYCSTPAKGQQSSTSPRIQSMFKSNVMATYGRFDICLDYGKGSYVHDVDGKKYLDVGGGIAVNSLGHAHPEILKTINEQASKLIHCSNLYYTESQALLAKCIIDSIGEQGKVFFSNSGAEANEGLYKLARAFGQDSKRYKVITATNSFHGRTLGGIAATGQDKIKKGFSPIIDGFKHVPFNDLSAVVDAIDEQTSAVLVEGIQGEGGVTPATPEYLLGLRKICDENGILLMFDSVQCGHFRTGRFQSYQRILEAENLVDDTTFCPDAISMAKSLGGGVPIGAFWVKEKFSSLLSPGMHGTTYGGNPLSCSVALKIFDV